MKALMTRPKKWFAANLAAKYRTELRLTQADVARACGVSQQAVQFWEAGLRIPGQASIRAMARLYGCTTECLSYLKDVTAHEDHPSTADPPCPPEVRELCDAWDSLDDDARKGLGGIVRALLPGRCGAGAGSPSRKAGAS